MEDNKVDWLGKPYYSLDAYFKHTYGQKIYKIAVDAGLTCPNRDGSIDNRGCVFCSAGGSGDFAVKIEDTPYSRQYDTRAFTRESSVKLQIERGMAKFNKRVGEKFVIYFQAYTNTYGDIDYLRRIWTQALDEENVVGISIATRPDCLGLDTDGWGKMCEGILPLLSELNKKYSACGKFIWIELGLQTIHEKTAGYIRRGYPLSVYEDATKSLTDIGIPFITHVILGLPYEDKSMMLDTVRYVCESGASGIKLQLLHVLKGTDLEKDYCDGVFSVMEMDEYIDLVVDAIGIIPEDIVIHRVTGDGPKNILVAPLWSGNKRVVLNTLHRRLKERGVKQGGFISTSQA